MKAAEIVKLLLAKKGISQVAVANIIGGTSQNLSKKLNQDTLDSQMIENISKAINYNLFQELAKEFEKETGIKQPVYNSKDVKTVSIEEAVVETLVKRFPNIFK